MQRTFLNILMSLSSTNTITLAGMAAHGDGEATKAIRLRRLIVRICKTCALGVVRHQPNTREEVFAVALKITKPQTPKPLPGLLNPKPSRDIGSPNPAGGTTGVQGLPRSSQSLNPKP